jgi:hypothetical protein
MRVEATCLKESSMIPVWNKSTQLPLILLATMLLIGMLIVLVDLWWVRNDGLRGAASSKFGPFRAQLGIALVSNGFSAFLSISPLTPQSWHGTEGFVIELFFLYLLLACLRGIWSVIWINEGYRRREREGARDSSQDG